MHDSYNPTSKLGLTREGASSICPFRISEDEDSLVELPITIPEDFEVYDSRRGSSSIIEKQLKQIDQIKRRKGMAVLVVHPEPHLSARKQFFEAFKEILHTVSLDSECWICRPRDIYQYWIDKEKKRYGAIEKKCIYS
jgi:predicted Zn-ribbon and HTH transcriptional regulator